MYKTAQAHSTPSHFRYELDNEVFAGDSTSIRRMTSEHRDVSPISTSRERFGRFREHTSRRESDEGPVLTLDQIDAGLASLPPQTTTRRKPVPNGHVHVLNGYQRENGEVGNPLLPMSEAKAEADTAPKPRGRHGRVRSTLSRIGPLAHIIIGLGTTVVLASLAFLTFLWFSSSKESTWRAIAVTGSGWMTRAVALTALCLRAAIALQASILTAMLASLALERGHILAIQLATFSTMRNSNSGPFWLTYQLATALFKIPHWLRKTLLLFAAVLLLVSTLLIQFSSTVLLSDLDLRPIPGKNQGSTAGTNFIFELDPNSEIIPQNPYKSVSRATAWSLHPPLFPTFAEYTEPPAVATDNVAQTGVRDTGLTLRAFLPIEDQQSRYSIRNYSGRATVLDNSVTCMRPQLNHTNLKVTGGLPGLALVTQIAPSVTLPSIYQHPIQNVDYNGDFYNSNAVANQACLIQPSDPGSWGLSFCQIEGVGSLLSAVTNSSSNITSNRVYGASYLAVNITSGTNEEWVIYTAQDAAENNGIGGAGFNPFYFADNGEWIDLLFNQNGSLTLSVSLCYTAFDSQDLFISAFSSENRTEPTPVFDQQEVTWRYDNIRRQLGQSSDGSFIHGLFEDRGVLQLNRSIDNWHPILPQDYARPDRQASNATGNQPTGFYSNTTYMSFLLDAAKMEGPYSLSDSLHNNYSAILSGGFTGTHSVVAAGALGGGVEYITAITPEATLTGIVQEILKNGGDIAHALQSLITVMSGLTYYDQLQQFNGQSETQQTMFELVLVPVRHRGYIGVLVVSLFHLLLMFVIIVAFVAETSVSSIGSSWQSTAQIRGPETRELLDRATLAKDVEVKDWMRRREGHLNGNGNFTFQNDVPHQPQKRSLRWDDVVAVRATQDGAGTELVY